MSTAPTAAAAVGDLATCLARLAYGRELRSALMSELTPADYTQGLLDAVALFEELGIGYALIGGVASMYYGRPRFTEDVDFVATSGHMDILAAHPEAMRGHHFDPKPTWKLFHESGAEIDIWKDEHADGIIARARDVALSGRQVKVADVVDLVATKLRAGRLQDDSDIGEILRRQAVDETALAARVTGDELAHFRAVQKRVWGESRNS